MLLEVNRLRHLIVDRPGRAEVDLWSKVSTTLNLVILAVSEDERAWWTANLPGAHATLIWTADYVNEVAANISCALEVLDSQPYETAYCTTDPFAIAEAMGTRVGTVLRAEGVADTIPDIVLFPNDDESAILGRLAEGKHYALLSELCATRYGKQARAVGTGFFFRQKLLKNRIELDEAIRTELDIVVAGRYFPIRDARHTKHQLSMRLLYFKKGDRRGHSIVESMQALVRHAATEKGVDIVTRVPPKPSKPRDRLGDALAEIGARFQDVQAILSLDAVRCVKDFPQQTSAGGWNTRVDNVRGAFDANSARVRGRRVLLVDDVLTSGATVVEVASTFYAAGAISVVVCPIAIDEQTINYSEQEHIPCPTEGCGGTIALRYPVNSDKAFWGCTSWPDCPITSSFASGLRARNERND